MITKGIFDISRTPNSSLKLIRQFDFHKDLEEDIIGIHDIYVFSIIKEGGRKLFTSQMEVRMSREPNNIHNFYEYLYCTTTLSTVHAGLE
jgi:hypothetical protein